MVRRFDLSNWKMMSLQPEHETTDSRLDVQAGRRWQR